MKSPARLLQIAVPADHHHAMRMYFLLVCAVILPGGALLVLLRWLWLRAHFHF